jgi:hypothetical protein
LQILPKEDDDARAVVLDSLLKDSTVVRFDANSVEGQHTPAENGKVGISSSRDRCPHMYK